MIKGLAITPPAIGRISIGKVVEKNGKRLPEKDDQFTITTLIQTKEGWLLHPIDELLRETQENKKIRAIPIRLMFSDPALNFRVEYSKFDRETGRPMCVGNGETCKRFTAEGIQSFQCPSPESCDLAKNNQCKPYGRLNVLIGGDDPAGSFIFRTTGFNSIRTLLARLHYFKALSGDKLACLPLELRLRGKSTTQSHRTLIYYVDLTLQSDMTITRALEEAQRIYQQRVDAGFDQAALDEAARLGFANGAFEDGEEEVGSVVEEFFAEDTGKDPAPGEGSPPPSSELLEKLNQQGSVPR